MARTFLSGVVLCVVALAAPAFAQTVERDPKALSPSGQLAPGDVLAFDMRLAVGWTIDEIRDPLLLVSRLTLEVVEDGRFLHGDVPAPARTDGGIVLAGRLEVRTAAYAGPSHRWQLEPGASAFRSRLRAIRTRLEGSGPKASYGERVAQSEELLGVAAVTLGTAGRPFLARVTPGAPVVIEPLDGDTLVPDLPPSAERVLRSYLAQAVRFVLPEVRAEAEADAGTGVRTEARGRGARSATRAKAAFRLDGVRMTRRSARNFVRESSRQATLPGLETGVGEGAADLAPGLPFTLEALLDARYALPDAGADPPRCGSLDLAIQQGSYRSDAVGRLTVNDRYGFAIQRTLEIEEAMVGTPDAASRVEVLARLRWSATLRDSRLSSKARETSPEP